MNSTTGAGRLKRPVSATPREGTVVPQAEEASAGEHTAAVSAAPVSDISATESPAGRESSGEASSLMSVSEPPHEELPAKENEAKGASESEAVPAPANDTEDVSNTAKGRHDKKKEHRR
jgi:hypothetical protein